MVGNGQATDLRAEWDCHRLQNVWFFLPFMGKFLLCYLMDWCAKIVVWRELIAWRIERTLDSVRIVCEVGLLVVQWLELLSRSLKRRDIFRCNLLDLFFVNNNPLPERVLYWDCYSHIKSFVSYFASCHIYKLDTVLNGEIFKNTENWVNVFTFFL